MQFDFDTELAIEPCPCSSCAARGYPSVVGKCSGWVKMLLEHRFIHERTSQRNAYEILLRISNDNLVHRRAWAGPGIGVAKVLQDMTAAERVALRERVSGVLRFANSEPKPETSAPVL